MDLGGITVSRWRRYGKDRLYVTRPDGSKVGWADLVNGDAHPESPDDAMLLWQALADWKGSRETGVSAEPRSVPPEEPWTDLAPTVAGAAAREQAVAAREAAPVRTFVARVLGLKTDERAWRLGADGEESVAHRLVKVMRRDPRWRVLHAIRVGDKGADIDHLVIGPGGVFSINAKHHPDARIWVAGDTFMVNGARTPYVRNSRHEAARASRLLTEACGFEVQVSGVIAVVNAGEMTLKQSPVDVAIVRRMQLKRWLLRRPEMLEQTTIEAIYQAARRSTTWCK